MPREGAKQVKKSAWLVGTNWIPELVPRVPGCPQLALQALVEKVKLGAALVPLA